MKVLRRKSGGRMAGFQMIEDAGGMDDSEKPLIPAARCKRCGCWLRAAREGSNPHGSSRREYCSACEKHIKLHARICANCGTPFSQDDEAPHFCPRCEEKFKGQWRVCRSCGERFLPYGCRVCRDRTPEDLCFSCHWKQAHAIVAAQEEQRCRICGCAFRPRRCIVPECGVFLDEVCPACHETRMHAGMTAIVWTLFNCPTCDAVIGALEQRRRTVTVLSLEKLVRGEEPDVEAMAQYAMSGGYAPLVFLDGRFLEGEEIRALAAAKERP